jgi:hypothetical protein
MLLLELMFSSSAPFPFPKSSPIALFPLEDGFLSIVSPD